VTYGAGALNMVNPVAAAWAEKTPLLVLTGGPGKAERGRGILVHHQVKTFDSQLHVYREVTHYQAVLADPELAAFEIRRAIDLCRRYALPVYLEVPRDMVDAPIPVGRPQELPVPRNEGAVKEAAEEILGLLSRAARPVLVVGVEIHRAALAREAVALAEALQVPVVSTFMGRGTFPDDHPLFAGVYLGPASPPGVRELVEGSDGLVMLGALLSDTNMGVHLQALDPRRVALAVSYRVEIGYHGYGDVPLPDLVAALSVGAAAAKRPRRRPPRFERRLFSRAEGPPAKGQLTVAELIGEVNRWFARRGELALVTDTGDCLFCSHEIDTQTVLASAYYATMGFGVPAALGFEAATGHRPLVLVGDGGFQMTGPELIHAHRWGLRPIVVVMNNGSWEMLQSFLPTGYNQLCDWRYAEVARLWGLDAHLVRSAGQLRRALEAALEAPGPVLIEALLEKGDISATLRSFTRAVGTTPPPAEPG
jgi:indolepyruvate decarboxylase